MTNSQKMTALMTRLRVEMNGVVVDAMRERGIEYPLSFGVSVPTIREISAEYAPDHRLATLLWKQSVRELRLAALTIADPREVSVDVLPFWGDGVDNIELAEHLATILLCRTDIMEEVIERWLWGESALLQYTALLAMTRELMITKLEPRWDWRRVMERLAGGDECVSRSEDRFVWQGMGLFMGRLLENIPQSSDLVEEVMESAKRWNRALAEHIEVELRWRL